MATIFLQISRRVKLSKTHFVVQRVQPIILERLNLSTKPFLSVSEFRDRERKEKDIPTVNEIVKKFSLHIIKGPRIDVTVGLKELNKIAMNVRLCSFHFKRKKGGGEGKN